MSYETTVTIGVAVKDGPPAVAQKSTTKDVIAANSKRIVIEPDKDPVQGANGLWNYKFVPVMIVDEEDLAFYTLSADRYTFKDCGNDEPGIGFVLGDDKSKIHWIDSPRVFPLIPGQTLVDFKNLTIVVNTELFDCSKPKPDPVKVTITYGLKSSPETIVATLETEAASGKTG